MALHVYVPPCGLDLQASRRHSVCLGDTCHNLLKSFCSPLLTQLLCSHMQAPANEAPAQQPAAAADCSQASTSAALSSPLPQVPPTPETHGCRRACCAFVAHLCAMHFGVTRD